MNTIIQILTILILIGILIILYLGIMYLLTVKEIKQSVTKFNPKREKRGAVIFTDEPKTEEEEAIEREEKMLKKIGSIK